MSRCDLFLENYEYQYNAGQQIIGHLQCIFNSEKTVKGLKVVFHGEASTHWSEQHSHYNSTTKKNETRTVWYRGEETLLRYELNLLNISGDEVTIPSGTHKYPFTYTLPGNLPSTFTGKHGEVKYTVKGVVNRPFLKFDYEAKSEIKIVCPLDLNLKPDLREPWAFEDEKNVCCCCFRSGPLSFEIRVPYAGYTPGQNIPLELSVTNLSNANVDRVKFWITQRLTFISQTPSHKERHYTDTIAELNVSGVGAHGERKYEEVLKVTPNFNPPNLDGTRLINVSYLLQVELFLPYYSFDMSASHRIVIGDIPLQGLNLHPNNGLPSYNSLEGVPAAPPVIVPPSAPGMPYPSAPGLPYPSAPGMPSASAPTPSTDVGWQVPPPNEKQPFDANEPPPNYDQAMLLKM